MTRRYSPGNDLRAKDKLPGIVHVDSLPQREEGTSAIEPGAAKRIEEMATAIDFCISRLKNNYSLSQRVIKYSAKDNRQPDIPTKKGKKFSLPALGSDNFNDSKISDFRNCCLACRQGMFGQNGQNVDRPKQLIFLRSAAGFNRFAVAHLGRDRLFRRTPLIRDFDLVSQFGK
jgi:hypothetical protein